MVGFPLDSRVTYVTDPGTGAITPQYDRAVTSKPLKAYIRGIITTGVLPNPSDNLQVFPGTDGMTVIVHAGFAVIDGGLAKEDNNRTLEVTASDATYDRIDTVVVRWNDNDSVRNVDLYIKQGVPARNPVRPTLTREGSVYEIGLADIFVTKNVRTITAEKITDTRLESSRCGVASSIAKWDTTTIYQQIQGELAKFKSDEEVAFATWFDYMKDQLTTDAAGKLQTEVDDVQRQICTNLLNPTAQTQTIHGVTFTNNGDGTYTVNGKARGTEFITIWSESATKYRGKNLCLCGCPSGGANTTYQLTIRALDANEAIIKWWYNASISTNDTVPQNAERLECRIYVYTNTTVDNLVFKPMLTTDLSATYDDFVPYTGDSGRLNKDVADVTSKLQNLQVGGRNLIKDSKGEFSGKYLNNDYIDLVTYFTNLPAYATQFVLSFEVKSTVAGDIIHSFFYFPSNVIRAVNSDGIVVSDRPDGNISTTLTTDWKRYWVKWTAPIANGRSVIPARLVNGEGTGTVSIRDIKFETGNTPTDWSPAPEDLETVAITNSEIDTILNS